MGKYLKEKCENPEDLRKQRKEFYQFFIVAWFLIRHYRLRLINYQISIPKARIWLLQYF